MEYFSAIRKNDFSTFAERLWTLRNKLRASEGRGVGKWDGLVMRSEEGTVAWYTGCYTQLLKHRALHRKPGMYCMVTNIIKIIKIKKT